VLFAFVFAVIENAPPARPLDPNDPSPSGGRALAQLVRDRGVAVEAVRRVGGAPLPAGTTVFVPDPASLSQSDLNFLTLQAATVVLMAPEERELQALGLGARPAPLRAFDTRVDPSCTFGPAVTAGRVRYQGPTYVDTPGTTSCYGRGNASGLFVATSNAAKLVVFGSPSTFTNDWLDQEGDAALGLGLLSSTPRLMWVVPRPPTQAPSDTRHRGVAELLPHRLLWATLQLLVAVLLLALWRGRRMGPVVAEPLPVVVRATETVEGRARLLRAARARDAAGTALRTATIDRLRDRIGLGADAAPPAIVEAVARHSGWSATDVDRILFGPLPNDDAALLRLTNELDQLDSAVRRSW
jgi:uncharacterized protein DUF4350